MKQLHEIQIKVLEKLLFSPNLNYSILRPYRAMENNKFNFHLKQLIDGGYIKKVDGLYSLTEMGKEFANRIDTNSVLKLQAKIAVILVCLRKNNTEALIHTRLKHPFYGCQGYMSGKIMYGESIHETVKRELKEEANLKGKGELFLTRHEIVYSPLDNDLVLEDKFLHFFVIRDPTGKANHNDEGRLHWVNINDMRDVVKKPFVSIETHLEITNRAINFKPPHLLFEEKKIISHVF